MLGISEVLLVLACAWQNHKATFVVCSLFVDDLMFFDNDSGCIYIFSLHGTWHVTH